MKYLSILKCNAENDPERRRDIFPYIDMKKNPSMQDYTAPTTHLILIVSGLVELKLFIVTEKLIGYIIHIQQSDAAELYTCTYNYQVRVYFGSSRIVAADCGYTSFF